LEGLSKTDMEGLISKSS